MADASAVALGGLLLEGDPPAPPAGWAAWSQILAGDPPLAVWVAMQADRHGAEPPAALADLAGWFARHALGHLRWDGGSQSRAGQGREDVAGASRADPSSHNAWSETRADAAAEDPPVSGFSRPTLPQLENDWGLRVAQAVSCAELAVRLAAPHGSQARDRAALVGLLLGAGAWPVESAAPPADPSAGLPAWLVAVGTAQDPAAAAALQAAGALRGSPEEKGDWLRRPDQALSSNTTSPATVPVPFSPADIDLDSFRRFGDEARRQWLAAAGPSAEWLPRLADRLARLARLETSCQEVIETEKLSAMAEFAAGAGHEINTPLAVIAGRSQLLLRDETDPERRRSLALIGAQAMRIYEMIADLRLFARPPRPEPQRVDLAALADRVVGELAMTAEAQETALRRNGPAGPVEIQADPVQIAVALKAVIQNALESLGYGGHVEVAIRPLAAEVELSVTDDGPGIAPEERRHLFDPFYSARQAGRGLGMGLAKCWRIVTNHGGRVDVQSQGGRGATVTIRLPAGESGQRSAVGGQR